MGLRWSPLLHSSGSGAKDHAKSTQAILAMAADVLARSGTDHPSGPVMMTVSRQEDWNQPQGFDFHRDQLDPPGRYVPPPYRQTPHVGGRQSTRDVETEA